MKTALAAVAALAFSACAAFTSGTQPKVGEAAPGFTLPSSNGKQVSLADYKGQSVVLAFFFKAFTSG